MGDGVPAILLINTKDAIKKPLQIILRKSIDEGVIPDIFKLAYITPIHKGGSKLTPENYRPISLTSHIKKVFERVLKVYIVKHLEKNKLLKENQHVFISGRITQTQLLRHYWDIFEALSEGIRIDTVYRDFAKAFDKVNHDILLEKVIYHRIKGKIGVWIRKFLHDRKYKVVTNGAMSEEQNVMSGVPQGTVLASLFFIIMISDIDDNILGSIVRLFADDTKVSAKIKNEGDTETLQHDLDVIYRWADENHMEFNENKFEMMSHGNNGFNEPGKYKTKSGKEIKPSKTVKDLGVLTSKDVSFEEHIENVVQSSKIMSGLLLRNFETRDPDLMIKMFNAYIKSKIEYCSLIWNPWEKEDIDKLERIQKNCTSKIKGMENMNYHERLIKLNLYSLERRQERFMIINAWEQLEGIKENVLRLETGTIGRRRCIRSTTIPTILNGSNRTMIHYSTARQMERLFNTLPYRIQKISGVKTDTFKKKLDEWLREIPDTPKIDDYSASVSAETKSIVDQKNKRKKNKENNVRAPPCPECEVALSQLK